MLLRKQPSYATTRLVAVDRPWGKQDQEGPQPRASLDHDHFGLDKVKERIVEYLAVQTRATRCDVCLVGPPGVGRSAAKATGHVSLGRRSLRRRRSADIAGPTFGSMSFKIIQSMRKAKTSNPASCGTRSRTGADFRRGSVAPLEVLDPEHNQSFNDHYLEVDYDLSNVMFITTANTLSYPPPLMDRMEIEDESWTDRASPLDVEAVLGDRVRDQCLRAISTFSFSV